MQMGTEIKKETIIDKQQTNPDKVAPNKVENLNTLKKQQLEKIKADLEKKFKDMDPALKAKLPDVEKKLLKIKGVEWSFTDIKGSSYKETTTQVNESKNNDKIYFWSYSESGSKIDSSIILKLNSLKYYEAIWIIDQLSESTTDPDRGYLLSQLKKDYKQFYGESKVWEINLKRPLGWQELSWNQDFKNYINKVQEVIDKYNTPTERKNLNSSDANIIKEYIEDTASISILTARKWLSIKNNEIYIKNEKGENVRLNQYAKWWDLLQLEKILRGVDDRKRIEQLTLDLSRESISKTAPLWEFNPEFVSWVTEFDPNTIDPKKLEDLKKFFKSPESAGSYLSVRWTASPEWSKEINEKIGTERANNFKNYLVKNGISQEKIQILPPEITNVRTIKVWLES